MDGFVYVPLEKERRFMKALLNYQIDPTGALLLPGYPEKCEGNGEHPDYECCCDACDYYLECFPEAMPGDPT